MASIEESKISFLGTEISGEELFSLASSESLYSNQEFIAWLKLSYCLDEKELAVYISLVRLFALFNFEAMNEKKDPVEAITISFEDLKQDLPRGLKFATNFRKIRRRLEAKGLIIVKRTGQPYQLGQRGVSYSYLLPPITNRIELTTWSPFTKTNNNRIIYNSKLGLENRTKWLIPEKKHKEVKPQIDGVQGWEDFGTVYSSKPTRADRGNISDPIAQWNSAHRLNYFLKVYQDLYNQSYILTKGRGEHERWIAKIPCTNELFKAFIDWLAETKKLKSLNFLLEQWNDFVRANPISPDQRPEKGIKGEFLKVDWKGQEIVVLWQYATDEELGKRVIALEALEQGIITIQQIVEWELCPMELLERKGLIHA